MSRSSCYIFLRVFAIVLLFTPSLGLFDTLHHGRLAALSVNDYKMEFDLSDDGTPITFQDAWEPYKMDHISDFLDIPVIGVASILVFMLLFHILGSACILKFAMRKQSNLRLLLEGFHTLITPPLHIDWEMFYRMSDGKESIKQSWKRFVA